MAKRPTWDEMKLARDGHLDPTKIPASEHAWLVPLHEVVEVLPNGNVITALEGGMGHIEWSRDDG